MRMRLAITALVFGSVLPVAGAHASPDAAGFTCEYTSTDDTGAGILQPNQQLGEIDGGPVVAADLTDLTANPAGAEIGCALNVNNDSYLGTHAVFVTSDGVANLDNDVVAYLPPTPITYIAMPTDNVYLCTSWWIRDPWGNYVHWYYDYTPDYASDPSGQTSLGFTTDGSAAKCGLALSAG